MTERTHDTRHGMHVGIVIGVLAGLLAVIGCAAAVVYALAGAYDAPLGGPNAPMNVRIDGPQLQSAPQYDRSRYFAEKDQQLERYEWIDRSRGIARIPIADAMRIMAAAPSRDARPSGSKPQESAQ